MSEISTESKGGNKKGKPKKKSTRVDFTPMVDLGFLLITFFMLTTTLIKPQTMEISMPSKDKVPEGQETKVKASLSITIVLGKDNKVFYFFGTRENNVNPKAIQTTYAADGIRKVLLERNISVMKEVADLKDQKAKKLISEDTLKARVSRLKSGKNTPVVLIKSSDEATYNDLVDILDEMQICNIGKYAIVDITKFDLDVIKESGFERPVAGKL
ncbi:MAG: biopolymer transporter ExbD [Bacteroidota bacterium]